MKNSSFEIRAAPAATPENPKKPAIREMTKKISAHFSMVELRSGRRDDTADNGRPVAVDGEPRGPRRLP